MPLLELQGIGDDQVRRGLDTLNAYLERLAFQPYVPAGIVGTGGAVLERPVLAGSSRDISAWKLPAAGTPVLTDSFGLPPFWVEGVVGLRIYYTGDTASTNNIGLRYDLDPIAPGEVPALASTATFTAPGPAAQGQRLSVDVPTLVSITGASDLVGWKLVRENPDAYANDIWVFGVRPLFYPRKQ